MKRTTIIVTMLVASYAAVAQDTINGGVWYAGNKLGWSKFYNTNWHSQSVKDKNNSYAGGHLGGGVFGGYQINRYLGLETSYDWLGRIPYKTTNSKGLFKACGVQLTTKLNRQVTDNLDMYARIGGMVWRADYRNIRVNNNSVIHTYETGLSPVIAGGLEWMITNNISTRLEYQWINSIGNANVVSICPNDGMLSLGVSYNFNQSKTIVPSDTNAPSQSKVISRKSNKDVIQGKNTILKSNILFDFNQANLKIDGQKSLNQFYNKLSRLDPNDISVIVLGFADRIGSECYNQNLSERRAQSVVNYLISKGVPSDKILVRGSGKSNSLTSNLCENIKNRSKLINCLAPDRRVELEVKNIKHYVR